MIEIKNLCKTYVPKNGVPVKALDNVSIQIAEKGMVFVLGKSGSGKSTFLNVLGGLDKYDSGELIVYGKSSKDFSQSEFDSYRNTYIGFIFQEYNIMDEFSVGQNIALALQLQGKKATPEAVASIMEQVDLKGFENRKTNELSGGQKQRVAIARALIKDPKIIMADEPTGALDSKTGEQVFDTLKKLSKDKLVLIVSHDRDFAERYADRIIEFSDGKVVSDTVKTEVAATSESEAVNVIDGKILQIKSGTTLTKKDLDVINSYIRKNEGDTFISMDGELNKELRKTSKITDGGAKETFKTTEQEDVKVKQYGKGDFNTVKSRLPFGNSLKIALSSLKTKPIRLFFTILLSAVAFTLFGLMSVFSTYDRNLTYAESIAQAEMKTVKAYRTEAYVSDFDGETYYMTSTLSSAEYDKVVSDLADKGLGVLKVADRFSLYYNDLLGNQLHNFNDFYVDSFGAISTIDDDLMRKFGFEKVAGTLPVAENEIAVTYYFYECYKYSYSESKHNELTPQSLIGKTFNYSNETYTITAVIDTNFNKDGKFDILKNKDVTSSDLSEKELEYRRMEFEEQIHYGIHNLCFVSPAYLAEYEIDKTLVRVQMGGLQCVAGTRSDSNYFDNIYSIGALPVFENNRGLAVYYPGGKNITSKSIVVGYKVFEDMTNQISVMTKLEDNYRNLISQLEVPPYFADLNEYCDYLKTEGWNSSSYGKSGKEIAAETVLKATEMWWNSLDDEEKYFRLERYSWGVEQSTETVATDNIAIAVGQMRQNVEEYGNIKNFGSVIDTGSNSSDIAFIGDGIVSAVNGKTENAYSSIITQVPNGNAQILELVEYFDMTENSKGWQLEAAVLEAVMTWDLMITALNKVFLYTGIGLAVFAAFLMMNFISTSIVYKKREIGILRAIGARGSDVFGIFFKEAVVIALINFVLALGFVFASLFGLNNVIESTMAAPISLFNMTFLTPVLMIGLSLATAAVASFIPCYKISIKRPIDAIRNK